MQVGIGLSEKFGRLVWSRSRLIYFYLKGQAVCRMPQSFGRICQALDLTSGMSVQRIEPYFQSFIAYFEV